jgi:hypothetical protein
VCGARRGCPDHGLLDASLATTSTKKGKQWLTDLSVFTVRRELFIN